MCTKLHPLQEKVDIRKYQPYKRVRVTAPHTFTWLPSFVSSKCSTNQWVLMFLPFQCSGSWCCQNTSSGEAAWLVDSATVPGYPLDHRWTGNRTLGRAAVWSPSICPRPSGCSPARHSSLTASLTSLQDTEDGSIVNINLNSETHFYFSIR